MTVDKYKICSLALTEIGMEPIASFNEENDRSAICGEIWNTYSRYLLSIFPWSFTRKKTQLAKLSTAPVGEYRNAFQLPGNNLRLRGIYSTNAVGAIPYPYFEIFDSRVLTNINTVWADYQIYVEPNRWPYWFVEFAVQAFAAKFGAIIVANPELVQMCQTKAFGPPQDNNNGGLYGQAKRIDSTQQSSEPIRSFELIDYRFV